MIRIQPGSDIRSASDDAINPSTPAKAWYFTSVLEALRPGLSVKMAYNRISWTSSILSVPSPNVSPTEGARQTFSDQIRTSSSVFHGLVPSHSRISGLAWMPSNSSLA